MSDPTTLCACGNPCETWAHCCYECGRREFEDGIEEDFGQCGVEGHASEQLAADTTSMFKHGSGSVTSMQPQQVSSPATVHSFIAHPQPLFRIEFEQGRVRV
jgi:hypothetical protein